MYCISTSRFYLVKLHVISWSCIAIVITLSGMKHQMLHKIPQIDTSERDHVIPYPYSQIPPWCGLFSFFFFGRPCRYASGHVLFYDCARNERDAREKIENEWVGGWRSDIENAKLAVGYKSLAGRSVGRSVVRLVPGPPWARSLPNQFKWFRKALPLHHLSPCNDRHRLHVYAPWWSTCVGGCCTVLRAQRTHAYAYALCSYKRCVPLSVDNPHSPFLSRVSSRGVSFPSFALPY